MNYRTIIADSWEYTQKNKSLIFWLGFVPAILTTPVAVAFLAFQFFSFKQSTLYDPNYDGSSFASDLYGYIWGFLSSHGSWAVPLIIVTVILLISFLLLPTLAQAAAIQKIARNRNGQKATVGTGIKFGIFSFLALLEYHLLIKTFSFFSILMEMSFTARNLGVGIFKILLPFFVLFLLIGLLLTLLLVYADFFIVIDGDGVFKSMKKSIKLVISSWKHTFLITMLLLLIGARIVIQVVIIFMIPALIAVIVGYLATVALPIITIIVAIILGTAGLLLAAYLNGIVDIFVYTVWTFTFLELTSEKELSARDSVDKEVREQAEEVVEAAVEQVFEEREKEEEDDEKDEPHHYEGHKNL
jgi:hypothetical protein